MQRHRHTSRPRITEKLADSITTLAHWLRQVGMDSSGLSIIRLTMSTEFGELFWYARSQGEYWRGALARELYRGDGYINAWPDPRGYIPYSARRFILQAATSEHIELLRLSASNRAGVQAISGNDSIIYAWMQTYPGEQGRPILFLDEAPPPGVNHEEHNVHWTWQAAQVLGQYFINRGLYHGDLAPAGMILPPDGLRDTAMCTILHMFAKAFLDLPPRCPPQLQCACNSTLDRAALVPDRHQEMTGELRLEGRAPTLAPAPRPADMQHHGNHDRTLRAMYTPRAAPPSRPMQGHPSFPSEPGWGSTDPQATGSRGGKSPHNDLDDTMRLDR